MLNHQNLCWQGGGCRHFVAYERDDHHQANTRHSTAAVSMLAHRLRRWYNIKTVVIKGLVFVD